MLIPKIDLFYLTVEEAKRNKEIEKEVGGGRTGRLTETC